jgi:hypothetical protein
MMADILLLNGTFPALKKRMFAMRTSFRHAAVALAALAFFPAAAQATMTASLGSVTPAVGGFRFSYNVSFDGADLGFLTVTLEPGDFFTIYDFAGFVPGTNLQPANWTFSSALTGAVPSGTTTTVDNPAVPNLTWTYGGASRIDDGSLGAFSAISTLGGTTGDFFAAQNTQTITGIGPTPASNIFPISVPAAAPVVVPEPGTLALLGGVVLGAFGVRRRRKAA